MFEATCTQPTNDGFFPEHIVHESFARMPRLGLALLPLTLAAAELRPLMLVPDKVLFEDDFSQPRELKAVAAKSPQIGAWNPNQGTRWKVADGVLKGEASSPEFQAAHETHKGVHPRIVLTRTPADYVLK